MEPVWQADCEIQLYVWGNWKALLPILIKWNKIPISFYEERAKMETGWNPRLTATDEICQLDVGLLISLYEYRRQFIGHPLSTSTCNDALRPWYRGLDCRIIQKSSEFLYIGQHVLCCPYTDAVVWQPHLYAMLLLVCRYRLSTRSAPRIIVKLNCYELYKFIKLPIFERDT